MNTDYSCFFENIEIPDFYSATQSLCNESIEDIPGAVREEVLRSGLLRRIPEGASVALTAGSREIANIDKILRTLCDLIKEAGARPFIIPAMGSHGGANAENQRSLIAHFGVTEEAMGVPILSSMETDAIGTTVSGNTVYLDRFANGADLIIPVGRIKPHTGFHGPIESGVMKMLAVGCGKQKGAASIHQFGFAEMSRHVIETASVILGKKKVPFGFGIIENYQHRTHSLYAIAGDEIYEREQELLKKAYSLMPTIPFDKVDILIVDEIGKNISGTGMDSNITGRSALFGITRPFVERAVVLNIAKESEGNAYGMGNADVIPKHFFDAISFSNTYPNGLTSLEIRPMRIPVIMPDDESAVKFALRTLTEKMPAREPYIVWLHNTASMEQFYVSGSLAACPASVSKIQISKERFRPQFGADKNFDQFIKI